MTKVRHATVLENRKWEISDQSPDVMNRKCANCVLEEISDQSAGMILYYT